MIEYEDEELKQILKTVKTIVMIGLSASSLRASYFVGRYFKLRGVRIIPVNPVYSGQALWNETVYAKISDIPNNNRIDMVDIFRASSEVKPIVKDTIKYLKPMGCKTIWMQIGVQDVVAAKMAKSANMKVIMNRCPKIENQRIFGELRMGGFNTGIISSRLD